MCQNTHMPWMCCETHSLMNVIYILGVCYKKVAEQFALQVRITSYKI